MLTLDHDEVRNLGPWGSNPSAFGANGPQVRTPSCASIVIGSSPNEHPTKADHQGRIMPISQA
jgi:hypothetical protein